jgi:hypothetical protein
MRLKTTLNGLEAVFNRVSSVSLVCILPFYIGGYVWTALGCGLCRTLMYEWVECRDNGKLALAFGTAQWRHIIYSGTWLGWARSFLRPPAPSLKRQSRGRLPYYCPAINIALLRVKSALGHGALHNLSLSS